MKPTKPPMKTYNVRVKQVYTYEEILAESKEDAIQKVLDTDWMCHDEQDQPLEISAEEIK